MRDWFIGRIVAWPDRDPEDDDYPLNLRFSGCGEIVDVLEKTDVIEYLLVRKLPRKDFPEPPFLFIVDLFMPDLQFFDSIQDYEAWLDFLTSTPTAGQVVRLVKKGE